MTVFTENFSLSALLRSKSIDVKQIDLIDDNARLPSEELIVRVGLECSISSMATIDEDESIYSMNDPFTASTEFDLSICDLDVAGDARWGETTKKEEEQESLGCGPSRSAIKMVAQVRQTPQHLQQSLLDLPSTPIGPIKPARKHAVSRSNIDETIELLLTTTKSGLNAAPSTYTKRPYVSRRDSSRQRSPPKPAQKKSQKSTDRLQAQCQEMSGLVF